MRKGPRGVLVGLAMIAALPLVSLAQGNKWAVVVGVSKFPKLDQSLQLEYADKDAEAFAKVIQSPRVKQFCDGHGAFTCYILKGLNGEADAAKDGTVTIGELIRYLRDKVSQATGDKQTPQAFGEVDATLPLSYPDNPGVDLPLARLTPK